MRVILLAAAALALAQEPIRVTTRLIETNVVVRDAKGPVGGLTQNSFTLLEDGKPRNVAEFRVSKIPTEAPKPLPRDVFVNRGQGPAREPHSKALLIDALNTRTEDQNYARTQIIKMLDATTIQDPMAIFVMDEKFRVLQDFTTDKTKLLAAIKAFRPHLSRLLAASRDSPQAVYGLAGRRITVLTNEGAEAALSQRAEMSLQTFEHLADYMGRAPGRKALVWITDGFPAHLLLQQDTTRWRGLGDVAVYPIYAHGLGLTGEGIDAVEWVAEQTAGHAFFNRNDIGTAVREAIHYDDITYTLGFYAERDKPDGKFHEIKVEVDRDGVSVRARPGYFDRDRKLLANDDEDLIAVRVANDDFDAVEIGLAAAVERRGDHYRIALKVDAADLRIDPQGGRFVGSLRVAASTRNAAGKILDSAVKTVALDFSEKEFSSIRQSGYPIYFEILALPGAARIHVAIVDQSGAAGSVLVIPK